MIAGARLCAEVILQREVTAARDINAPGDFQIDEGANGLRNWFT
jgi:hypothetical protein